jgi:hypothetical protein
MAMLAVAIGRKSSPEQLVIVWSSLNFSSVTAPVPVERGRSTGHSGLYQLTPQYHIGFILRLIQRPKRATFRVVSVLDKLLRIDGQRVGHCD